MRDKDPPSKYSVHAVKRWCLGIRDKELRAVGVGSRICHGDYAALVVSQMVDNFVFELLSPNRLAPFSGASWVTSLQHKALDISVDQNSIIVVARCQRQKVLTSFCNLVATNEK